MPNYADSDAKTILTDVQLELISANKQIKVLNETIKQLSEDVEVMDRSLHKFLQSMKQTKAEIAADVAEVSATAFDEQLQKLEIAINRAGKPKKPIWSRFRS